jgi:aspartate racemase
MSKSIGLLQLGRRATDFYQGELLIAGVGLETVTTDFAQINEQLPDGFAALGAVLDRYLKRFKVSSHIIMPNVTLHETFDRRLREVNYGATIVHPLVAAVPQLSMLDDVPTLVIGSRYTMEGNYVKNYLAAFSLSVCEPGEASKKMIEALRVAVFEGKENAEQLVEFARFVRQAAVTQPVLIACSELSLLLPRLGLHDTDNVVDTASAQIQTALMKC